MIPRNADGRPAPQSSAMETAAPDKPRKDRFTSRRALLALLAGAALVGGGLTRRAFTRDLRALEARLRGRSRLLATRFGDLEFADVGEGAPLLMIHGTGGGFDQGLRFADRLLTAGLRVIAPSRFGYLRSAFPEGASPERQADAFVALLDHLRIDRLPVAGGSAGALSAAWFARRHPDRCTGLVLLVPAANVAGRDPVTMPGWQTWAMDRLLGSDALFWSACRLMPRQLIGSILATDPALLDSVSPDEARRARTILWDILPVSARRQGILDDARRAGSPAGIDFADIAAPTLILSTEDDRFGTAATARILAAAIPKARLVIYPTGGHIWLGHDAEVASEIEAFVASLSKAAPENSPRL